MGGYVVVRLLGRGANGEVFLVQEAAGARSFAMKAIPCDVDGGREEASATRTRDSALAEAKLLKDLRHPHIVACEDVFYDKESNVARLILEYMDGGDLHGHILAKREAEGSFDAHFARRVLAAVGGALEYIHANGILHRDVKPANVLLSRRSQRIKLADFGIAKLVEATTLRADTVVGTPNYFSPELVSGEQYGPASDCWALGVCLYQVVSLRRPFDASNQLALVQQICFGNAVPLPKDTADDIRTAVEGLLQKDPQQRLPLEEVLMISSAVAALVTDPGEGAVPSPPSTPVPGDGGGGFADTVLPQADGRAVDPTADTWADAEEITEDQVFGSAAAAAAAARAALAADVDDPEELHLALVALERQANEGSFQDVDDEDFVNSLCEELRLRVAAFKKEYEGLMDGFEKEDSSAGTEAEPATAAILGAELLPPVAESPGLSRATSVSTEPSLPRAGSTCDMRAAEDVIEVASTLGIDTARAEEQLACRRKMISIRVGWGDLNKFLLLPLRVSYESLAREVATRFNAPAASTIRLCWIEVGEKFPLESQAAWEECLQRRSLAEKPGRLELRARGEPPAQKRKAQQTPQPRRSKVAPVMEESVLTPPGSSKNSFMVTGMQAFPTSGAEGLDQMPSPAGRPIPGTAASRGVAAARLRQHRPVASGRAWAMATGRERPIHWAPAPGGDSGSRTVGASTGGFGSGGRGNRGLRLEGRPAPTGAGLR